MILSIKKITTIHPKVTLNKTNKNLHKKTKQKTHYILFLFFITDKNFSGNSLQINGNAIIVFEKYIQIYNKIF